MFFVFPLFFVLGAVWARESKKSLLLQTQKTPGPKTLNPKQPLTLNPEAGTKFGSGAKKEEEKPKQNIDKLGMGGSQNEREEGVKRQEETAIHDSQWQDVGHPADLGTRTFPETMDSLDGDGH